jgi:hypothetical protein
MSVYKKFLDQFPIGLGDTTRDRNNEPTKSLGRFISTGIVSVQQQLSKYH